MINVHNHQCVLWNVQMDKTIDAIDTSRTVVIPGSTLGTVWKLIWSAIRLPCCRQVGRPADDAVADGTAKLRGP